MFFQRNNNAKHPPPKKIKKETPTPNPKRRKKDARRKLKHRPRAPCQRIRITGPELRKAHDDVLLQRRLWLAAHAANLERREGLRVVLSRFCSAGVSKTGGKTLGFLLGGRGGGVQTWWKNREDCMSLKMGIEQPKSCRVHLPFNYPTWLGFPYVHSNA